MHIDHINIKAPMALLEEVRDFYCAVLDLRVGPRPNFSRRGFWLYSGENPLVHLTEGDNSKPGGQGGYLDHVAFRAEGLNAMLEKLESAGISYRKTSVPELGMTQLFFADPVGIRLEVNFVERGGR